MAKCWMINYVGLSACHRCFIKEGSTRENLEGFFLEHFCKYENLEGFFLEHSCKYDCYFWKVNELLKSIRNYKYYKLDRYSNMSWFKGLERLFETVSKREINTFMDEEYDNGKLLDDELYGVYGL